MTDFHLKVSEFFDKTPDLVCIAGRDGYLRKVNHSVISKLGYAEEELLSRPIHTFIHPEDKERTQTTRSELLEGKTLLNFENRYITKEGGIIWLEWTSIYLPDEEVVFAIAKDVSTRKQLETDIFRKFEKFKGLATHFKTSIEEDRKYLATELHEELAQLASVVKMDIDWIKMKEKELSETSLKRIEHASVVSDLLINTIRRISYTISPSQIEEHGLNATLEWHCREFSLMTGCKCSFEYSYDESKMPLEIKIDFYRICQEALSNIMYHAHATRANICIEDTEEGFHLLIKDDGRGFEMTESEKFSGLNSIHERAASINGRLSITSEPGKGTTISVLVKPQTEND